MLIDRFVFSPSKEEIVWNMNHIQTPTVKDSERSQLPLKVSIAA